MRRPAGRRTQRVAAALAAVLLGGSCSLNPYAGLVDVGGRQPRASECGSCHVAVYEEFQASRHAEAWDRPAFVEATAGRSIASCLGCHAPDSIYRSAPPRLRGMHRDEGVTCVSCHFDGEALTGPAPRSALVDPHPVVEENPLYRDAELCGRCHEGTYREWRRADLGGEEKRTCQECHMRPVRRKLTQPTSLFSKFLVGFEDEFDGRAHSFHVDAIADLDDAFLVDVREEADTLSISFQSRVPHMVPTGDFGFRKLRIHLIQRNARGETVADRDAVLFKELGDAIEPGGQRTWRWNRFPSASSLEIEVSSLRRNGVPNLVFVREFDLAAD